MHEMAMVRSVVDIVLEEAEHAGATEVLGVYLTVAILALSSRTCSSRCSPGCAGARWRKGRCSI